jgi:hypothetical protein
MVIDRVQLWGELNAERTWQCVCASIGATEQLYVPAGYGKSWKQLFFDMLYPARSMWHR